MPRVLGVRCDQFEHDEWRRLRSELLMPMVKQAKALGYDIGDTVADSCFYDGETLYFVDFHSVREW